MKLDNIDIENATNRIIEYLHPECIYVPIKKENAFEIQQKEIKKGQYVLEEEAYSSISGIITNCDEKRRYNNELVSVLKITNNFKEEAEKNLSSIRDLHALTKENFLKQLKKIPGNRVASLYDELNKNDIECLIIKCFDDEPLLANAYTYLLKDKEILLNTIDSLLTILGIKRAILLLKDSYVDLIPSITDLLSTFPNMQIKLINDVYPVKDNSLMKDFFLQTKKEEKKLVFLDIEQLIDIYIAIKRRKKRTEKYITISGNAITSPCVIYTKLGTSVKEIIDQFITFKEKEVAYTTNSPLCGYEITSIADLIITNDLEGIFINRVEQEEKECISCGKCYAVCPKGLNPKAIDYSKCIRCGLCSYFCPSKINLVKEEEKE